ncbi:MAG: porin [Exilibacterium sp.]
MFNNKYVSFRCASLAAVISCLAGSANASVNLMSTDEGWEANLSGAVPVFLVVSDFESGEDSSRIQSGFNPASLTIGVKAPSSDGLRVSGQVQIDTHLQGAQTQNSGLFESRIYEIQVDGDFGSVNIGKGFGIFNSTAIGDLGSGMGVGLLGNGADTGNATAGRIGTGYVYANFNPRITYTTPDMGGLKMKVGLFNPEEPTDAAGGVETSAPRIEAQLDYATEFDGGGFKFWTGFMYQKVELVVEDLDYDIQGADIGAHIDLGGFGLTLAYQDAHTQPFPVAAVTNELGMLFLRHKMTPSLTFMAEYQDYQSDVNPGDYNAVAIGFQYDF